MDEQARFETSAVLPPRRARLTRLALLLPALAFVATAWAGLSGARPEQATAIIPSSVAAEAPSREAPSPIVTRAQFPARVLGLEVQRLDQLGAAAIGRGELRAVAGWYVATTTIDCAPLADVYRQTEAPGSRPNADAWVADPWAYCDRFGLLYGSRPDLERSQHAGLPAVPVVLAFGILAPPELEVVGGQATPVVMLGRLDESGASCSIPARCGRALVVDHVAWSQGS